MCNHTTIYYLFDSSADGFLPYLAENLDEKRYLGKGIVSVSQSFLPLKEGYVLLYSKSFTKVLKLHPRNKLGLNIYSLVVCRNIPEFDYTFYTISCMN